MGAHGIRTTSTHGRKGPNTHPMRRGRRKDASSAQNTLRCGHQSIQLSVQTFQSERMRRGSCSPRFLCARCRAAIDAPERHVTNGPLRDRGTPRTLFPSKMTVLGDFKFPFHTGSDENIEGVLPKNSTFSEPTVGPRLFPLRSPLQIRAITQKYFPTTVSNG